MQYIETSVPKKGQLVSDRLHLRDETPLFAIVEFNIWGACNRRCSFCPVSDQTGRTNYVDNDRFALGLAVSRAFVRGPMRVNQLVANAC